MKSIKDFDVKDKRVLVRCDFNVPLDEQGNISNDYRIAQSLPTIKYLVEQNAKVILMSHLDPDSTSVADSKYNLNKIGEKLSELLDISIIKIDDCVGAEAESQSNNLKPGKILLLENLRFHKEETDGELEFAKNLAKLGDIYVNDAFSVCHRNHASISGVAGFLPHCMGLLLEKEIINLDKVMQNPERPMTALIGGTKVGTKSKLIEKVSDTADCVIISGLIKKEVIEKKIELKNAGKIIGPEDDLGAPDIDEKTIKLFEGKILDSKTILWNGPFGKFEDEAYAKGTLALANAIIDSKAFSVVGGGETVEFLTKQGILEKFSHVSTGGGAMLQYLAGDVLPGIEALQK